MTDEILAWSEIESRFGDAILIGNGASLAVSASFGYGSLLDVASEGKGDSGISTEDRKVFEIVNETDFERVLGEIDRAAVIAELAGVEDATPLRDQYTRIRTALIAAVHEVHPRHTTLEKTRFETVQESLLRFRTVFTTNYDLLTYWSIVATPKMHDFRDFFWNLPGLWFDPAQTWTQSDTTQVFYLHGTLHLFELPDGSTVKASGAGDGAWVPYSPLLDLTFDYQGARYPLFVSEGSSAKKIAAITSNAYLNFAYQSWIAHAWNWRESLVIFGHSLGSGDEHLVQHMSAKAEKAEEKSLAMPPLAVSIRPTRPEENLRKMEWYRERLRRSDVMFFDAATHPLGADG